MNYGETGWVEDRAQARTGGPGVAWIWDCSMKYLLARPYPMVRLHHVVKTSSPGARTHHLPSSGSPHHSLGAWGSWNSSTGGPSSHLGLGLAPHSPDHLSCCFPYSSHPRRAAWPALGLRCSGHTCMHGPTNAQQRAQHLREDMTQSSYPAWGPSLGSPEGGGGRRVAGDGMPPPLTPAPAASPGLLGELRVLGGEHSTSISI